MMITMMGGGSDVYERRAKRAGGSVLAEVVDCDGGVFFLVARRRRRFWATWMVDSRLPRLVVFMSLANSASVRLWNAIGGGSEYGRGVVSGEFRYGRQRHRDGVGR